MDEIAHTVELPPGSDDDYYTTEYYGLVEHHVRQIYTGVRGWFDDEPGHLFPLEPTDRASRLVEGFGGVEAVRDRVKTALREGDLRWALELSSWLMWRPDAEDSDRSLQAEVLRSIAHRTTAANIRSWCLTRARDIEGTASLDSLRVHRLREKQILTMTPETSIDMLRVLVDPERATGQDVHLELDFDGRTVGLHLRNCVSVRTDGHGASHRVRMAWDLWAKILGGGVALDDCISNGHVVVEGDQERVRQAFDAFDVDGLRGMS